MITTILATLVTTQLPCHYKLSYDNLELFAILKAHASLSNKQFYDLSFDFGKITKGKPAIVSKFPLGEFAEMPQAVICENICSNQTRKQLFVKLKMRLTRTLVLDFNGVTVKSLLDHERSGEFTELKYIPGKGFCVEISTKRGVSRRFF